MAQLQSYAGMELPADYPLIRRSRRDQAVIFDPGVAPLLLPLVQDADLHDFVCAEPQFWALQISAAAADEWPAEHERRPGLRLLLRDTAWGSARPCRLAAAHPAPDVPWIIATADGSRIALTTTPCLVAAPLTVLSDADETTLALLCCAAGRRRLAALSVGSVLEVPAVDAESAGRLQHGVAAARLLMRERLQRSQQFVRRVQRDFAPPGVERGAAFAEWADWSFAQLAAVVEQQLHTPIPSRFVPLWQQLHADAVAAEQRDRRELFQLQQTIEQAAAAFW
jgi:hypothetical protein